MVSLLQAAVLTDTMDTTAAAYWRPAPEPTGVPVFDFTFALLLGTTWALILWLAWRDSR